MSGKISLEGDRVYLHYLQDQPLPPRAVTVQVGLGLVCVCVCVCVCVWRGGLVAVGAGTGPCVVGSRVSLAG